MRNKTNTLVIQTPEEVSFSLLIASPVSRCFAWSIDCALLMAVGSLIGSLSMLMAWISWDLFASVSTLSYFIISIGYSMGAEWFWRGQTLGKRLLKLRVVDRQGFRLHASQIIIRNLLRTFDFLPLFYLLGGSVAFINRYGQRIGDIAANTIVIRIPTFKEPDLTQIQGGKYNSFKDYPHLMARLRQQITPEETQLLVNALLRRDQINPQDRILLYSEIADHLRKKVRFPDEASQGISDEQYVRNTVEVLFAKKQKR
jgi:uncharacterized RDD family membrane protein YckC